MKPTPVKIISSPGDKFRVIDTPGYGATIWCWRGPNEEQTALHFTEEEFVSLDQAVHQFADKIRMRIIAEWLARPTTPKDPEESK